VLDGEGSQPHRKATRGGAGSSGKNSSLLWPKLSRCHEGLKTGRAVLQAKLLEETKPLTSKAAMPVLQVHVRGAHHAVPSKNEG